MRTPLPTFILFVLGCLLFFFALGNHQLQGSAEPRVAGIAMEMYLDNDWIVPKLNGKPFLEKPPLSLWLDSSAIRLFGATPLAVRLASAFAGLFSLMLLYTMLRKFGRPATIAWAAAILMATTASYWSNSRQVGEDALLSLGVTLALLAFFHASRQQAEQKHFALGSWLLFASGIMIATLSKGVLGLALPGVVIFTYLVAESVLEKRLTVSRWLRPGLFTVVGLIPLLVWLGLLYQRGGMQMLGDVLWANSVGRFSGSFESAGHFEPFYYYLVKLPQAFLPWNLLVYFGLWHFRKVLMSNRYLLFFSLWLLAQFTLLTLASSKRMVYLMSLTPAAAVLAAEYAAVLLKGLKERAPTSTFAERLLRHRRVWVLGVLGAVIFGYLAAALWLAPRADRNESFVPLTAQIKAMQANGQDVVLFEPSERLAGATVFYSQSRLEALHSEAELTQFLSAAPGNVAIMERRSEPAAPLKVVEKITVGQRDYYFVGQ
jgi:4-amino-4-deoxy-L-arabinose transferase-like glycosyltransferase